MKTILGTESQTDAQLVEWSLTGDREAFGRIVERYQSLVCSITYGATGSLSLSEDIAQETFITAWRQLTALNDAGKLRAWLCGIARNLVNNSLRRGQHEPTHAAEPLETVDEPVSPGPSPSAQAVSREEEAILWRALERIPDTYREPLILFYREQQSVERVAKELELSEDAVKQRLSRGRKLLTDEVAAFVEGTLQRTAPGAAFSQAVLAALPLGAASAGASGAAAATKSAGLFAWLLPCLGILGGIAAHLLIARSAPTASERRTKLIWVVGVWIFVLAWAFPGQLALRSLGAQLGWGDRTFYAVMTGFWWVFSATIVTLATTSLRRDTANLRRNEQASEVSQATPRPPGLGTRVIVATGMYLAYFWGLIFMARQAHDRLWVGIITGIMVALGLGYFFQLWGKTGMAAKRAAIAHVALALGMVLVVLNLRVDVWLASYRGVSLPEIHQLLPMWVVHVLTLALVMWVGILLAMTRPKPAR